MTLFFVNREWGWIRSLQFLTIITLSTVISGIIYRSPSLYHPRRRAILHVKNQRKTKNQRREEKINYFDLSPLRMRSFQLLAFSTALISFGSFVPFGIPVGLRFYRNITQSGGQFVFSLKGNQFNCNFNSIYLASR